MGIRSFLTDAEILDKSSFRTWTRIDYFNTRTEKTRTHERQNAQ